MMASCVRWNVFRLVCLFFNVSWSVGFQIHYNNYKYIEELSSSTISYNAAVIEHEVKYANSTVTSVDQAREIMNLNIDILEIEISNASSSPYNVDIILIGEMALTSLNFDRSEMYYYLESIGSPNNGYDSTPCNNSDFKDRPIISRLSCIADKYNIYLAVNYGDIVECNPNTDSECPSDNHYQYNTEIVFNNFGEIIAKYHKIHTFNATEYNVPKKEDFITFDLILNNNNDNDSDSIIIPFGIMTCFDSIFYTPSINLINTLNISNFIVSHWWNNQNAMMNAVSWFQSVSRQFGINILVAATWWDKIYPWGSGSGIFSGGDILVSWYNQKHINSDQLLIAENMPSIPMTNNGPNSNLPNLLQPPYTITHTKPAPMCVNYKVFTPNEIIAGKELSGTVACGTFKCSVNAKVNDNSDKNNKEYWYLYVDTGYYYMCDGNNIYYYEEFCTFYKCNYNDGCFTSEEMIYDDNGNTMWDSIEIEANWLQGSVKFPMSSDSRGDVFKDIMSKVEMKTVKDEQTQSEQTTVTAKNIDQVLINLSVLGRSYDLDVQYVEP